MIKKITLFFGLLCCIIPMQAQGNSVVKMDSLLRYYNVNNKMMGQVSLRLGAKKVYQKTFGDPLLPAKDQPTDESRYRIGSASKTFTAVLIMQLVDEKKLKLSDALSKFYPHIKNAKHISIEDLLRHRSGIPDLVNADATTDFYKKYTKAQLLKKMEGYDSNFEPNTKAAYSNTNFILLSYIIEEVTNLSYNTNLQNRICKKVNLKYTNYPTLKNQFSKLDQRSYVYNNKQWEAVPESDNNLPIGAGGIVSTANDLTLFMNGLFENKLVSAASLEQMITIKDGYGLGIVPFKFGERLFYGHNGRIDKFETLMAYYPKEKFGISQITNGLAADGTALNLGIMSIYYKLPYEFPSFKSYDITTAEMLPYVGTYNTASFPMDIEIVLRDNQLHAQATGQGSFPLQAEDAQTFTFAPASIKMVFDAEGMTLHQSGSKIRFTKKR